MRMRLGHVTNSSSTNHMMWWKGKKEDLRGILESHANIFPTSCGWIDGLGTITPGEVIDAICSCADRITTAEEKVAQLRQSITYYRDQIVEEDQRSLVKPRDGYNNWMVDLYEESIRDNEELIRKSEGQEWFLEVGFGDNDGDFSGGDLGNIMDYEGRNISVNEPNFRYATEQNR